MHILLRSVAASVVLTAGMGYAAEPAALPAAAPAPANRSAATLRQAAEGRFYVGTATMTWALDNPAKAELIAREFNAITPENELKPMSVQRTAGKFTFEQADRLADFCKQHNIAFFGHTLVWHSQSPQWLYVGEDGKPLPREQALANMKAHIDGVMGHFKGRVKGWDVVNEAIADGKAYLRDTPAKRAVGDDYIIQAFKFAQAADPDAELYYNDFLIETPEKREKTIRLIRELKAAGAKIDGVGIQGHWSTNWPDAKLVEEAILAYKAEGVTVSITEMDMDVLPRVGRSSDINVKEQGANPYTKGCPPEVLQKQADQYKALFEVFVRHQDTVRRVTFWGVDDGASWLNHFPVRGRTNYPLLFDRQLQPKQAFGSVIEALRNGVGK